MRRVRDFGQSVAIFPQFIAGPIICYHQIDDELHRPPARNQRLGDLAAGFPRLDLGFSKKVLVADRGAPIVERAFASTSPLDIPAAWFGAAVTVARRLRSIPARGE